MIQFECPYCQAVLRVPDSAMGQQGACPKCQKSLLIPNPMAQQASPAAPVQPVTSQPPSGISGATLPPAPPKSADDAVGELFEALSHPEQHTPSEDPLVRVAVRKRRSSGSVLTGAVFILICVAGLYSLYYFLNPKMRGELTGTIVKSDSIPYIKIPRLQIADQAVFETFLQNYNGDRISINSQILKSSLEAHAKGIDIKVDASTTTKIVRVDVLQNKPLREFHREAFARIDKLRKEKLAAAITDFMTRVNETDQVLQSSRTLLEFRDRLILPACVNGLGYRLIAQAKGKQYPCLWQDKEDRLYFAVPFDVNQFEIIEREILGDARQFPANLLFTVNIQSKSATPAAKEESPTPTESELEEAGTSESGMATPEMTTFGHSMTPNDKME
ncbi:hypothetical protein [Rubinisphaera italica]|uniref:Uncharacterized protein n=1 Tax=Rubinisphaera italica TaxID=2527969 RepID=A0A5C5XKT4_9PLAN|nr:hypothetical protein [Rubinisphaera italica]TWT62352.1 hypothetical protein Pan54_30930 [Rubinisphaera italica]